MQGTQLRSLLQELRSHKPQSNWARATASKSTRMTQGRSHVLQVSPDTARWTNQWETGGGGRFKDEGTHVYLWLIHIIVRQKYQYNNVKQLSSK